MPKKLFISTSNAIFVKENQTARPERVLEKERGWFIFKRGGLGFFGIAYHSNSNSVIVASRERLGTKKMSKPTTDMKLYAVDAVTKRSSLISIVKDIHDVHQIAVKDDLVFITDCGKNRIPVFDLKEKRVVKTLYLGEQRDDINHLNALYVDDHHLYIGCNNRGRTPAEICKLPLAVITETADREVQIDGLGEVIRLKSLQHTHDIEPCNGSFLVSASHESAVCYAADESVLLYDEEKLWVRGLVLDKPYLWVGCSPWAKRSRRHKRLDGKVRQYKKIEDRWLLQNSFDLLDAGQINDIILV